MGKFEKGDREKMNRSDFEEMARNDPVGALLHLFDGVEAAELEIASHLHDDGTVNEGGGAAPDVAA